MSDVQIEPISAQDAATLATLLDLNNAHARETSFLTPQKWQAMVGSAFCATCLPEAAALLIAFEQNAGYDNANFNWFRMRLARFVYVDRIVIASSLHGRGLAGLMYRDLFERARAAGHDHIVCEVNLIPPNPASDTFHAKMGFTEVGRAALVDSAKTVRYLAKRLDGSTVEL